MAIQAFSACPLTTVDVLTEGLSALEKANDEMGLALSPEEIAYFAAYFIEFVEILPTWN